MKFKLLITLLTTFIIFAHAQAEQGDADISFYTGTFDVIDKEGDDQTTLFGVEHKNPNLFRDTFLGKFKPVTGAFMTGNSSVYLYTGIEGQYGIGPLKISPSFTPGYYEKGDGKDLGSVLEFKSEVKIGFDIFFTEHKQYNLDLCCFFPALTKICKHCSNSYCSLSLDKLKALVVTKILRNIIHKIFFIISLYNSTFCFGNILSFAACANMDIKSS